MKELKNLWMLGVICFTLLLTSCEKDDPIPDPEPDPDPVEETSQSFIYDTFKENYFWVEELPELDPNTYSNNEDLVDALRYEEKDRWSFVISLQEYLALFEQGETKGFGVGMARTQDNRLFVRFTYKDSPMGLAGVDRGWEFLKINDVPLDQISDLNAAFDDDNEVKFTFRTLDGETVERSMTRTDYKINTVLYKNVIDYADKKVGYLVFESFLGTSEEELDDAFDYFNQEGVDEIVVDLRYNGGGDVNIAFQMMELLGGDDILNKAVLSIKYNSLRTNENQSYGFDEGSGKALNLDHLYFITTESSASASELVINALYPFKDVTLVGERTHGKPVGMEVFLSEDYNIALAPVTFKFLNALGEGDYYDGLPVDYSAVDDISHAWGDPEEASLKTTLQVIAGEGDMISLKSASIPTRSLPLKRGLQEITQAF